MEYWEFLIQKEGDRSWLPLESPDVEILEGRYRVVARSSRVNTPVEIQISHQATAEIPPKRRTQRRFGQTNRDGLIVVSPFTRLQPGLWELRCAGDLMSDMMGESWRYAVKLQVLPQDSDVDEWDPDWQHGASQSVTQAPIDPISIPQAEGIAIPIPPDEDAILQAIADEANSNQETLDQPITAAALSELASESVEPTFTTERSNLEPSPADVALSDAEADITIPAMAASAEMLIASGPPATLEEPIAVPADEAVSSEPALSDLDPTTADSVADEAVRLEPALSDLDPATADSVASLFQMAEQMSEEVVGSIFDEFEPVASPAPDWTPSLPVYLPSASPFRLVLDQETFTARRGQPLTITGQLEAIDEFTDLRTTTELRVCLLDPQSTEALADTRQVLPNQALPIRFSCTIAIPNRRDTHLALGELTLYDLASEDAEPAILATQSFTVTTDLDELLEAISDGFTEFTEEADLTTPLEFTAASPEAPAHSLNLAFLDLVSTQNQLSLNFQPAGTQPLPPQIRQPETARLHQKPLELPFGNSSSRKPVISTNVAEAIASPTATASNVSVEAQPSEFPPLTPATNPNIAATVNEATAATLDQGQLAQFAGGDSQNRTSSSPLSPADRAFQSLNLQDKFLSRLNALAADAELSDWLRSLEPSEPPSKPAPADESPLEDGEASADDSEVPAASHASEQTAGVPNGASSDEPEWIAQEIVVDDEPAESSLASGQHRSYFGLAPHVSALSEEDILPTPTLDVITEELIAGQLTQVAVTLPALPYQVYVKLWIQDRQTRSLLDGPHWLIDFSDNGTGQQIARLDLTVPHGCLEVQFEAIAMEMTTQRESRKVTVDRLILPPDLPELSLDELDV